jgi:hypothetical protein
MNYKKDDKIFWICGLGALLLLLIILPVSAYYNGNYYVVARQVNSGATIFLGEQNLDISLPAPDGTVVGYWPSADRTQTSPSKKVTIISSANYSVTSSDYDIGNSIADWYVVDPGTGFGGNLAFRVADPALDISIWDAWINDDVTGKSIPQGDLLQVGIQTNQYAALGARRDPIVGNSTGDGYINIRVKNETGTVFTQLYTATNASSWARLTSINVTTQPYTWGVTGGLDNSSIPGSAVLTVPPFGWVTNARPDDQPAYLYGLG